MSTEDTDGTPLSPEEERILKTALERGLAKYQGKKLPPEIAAILREVGEHGLRTHPVARRLIARLAARPVPDVSGDAPKKPDEAGEGEAGGKGDA
jgi:hypothetical protein